MNNVIDYNGITRKKSISQSKIGNAAKHCSNTVFGCFIITWSSKENNQRSGRKLDFSEKVVQFAKRIENIKDQIQTEEATKTALIMPFFQLLGYDVFNPAEFMPEYTADVGIKKGEKIDYAIFVNGELSILLEAKSVDEDLDKHGSQLFRYYATSSARFGILTNGIIYKFYTDLEAPNKMDDRPFLEINLLDLKDNLIPEIKKFERDNYDCDNILNSAAELKYTSEMKKLLYEEMSNPSDDFVRFMLKDVVSPSRIFYRDTESYFGILLDDNKYKWICRVSIGKIQTNLFIQDENKQAIRYPLNSIDDIYNFQPQLTEAVQRHLAE
jgi:hypothetical protein